MDSILRQPQHDEYGLPILPNMPRGNDDETDEMMAALAAGDFSALGLPMPSSMPTAEEAQREARERSTKVLSGWNTLQQILERHEEVLRKRWLKKTKSQRTSIVLRAWPKMSAGHRPDYTALMKEGQHKGQGTKFREAYLWPYMNVEDLVKGKSLLLFLNSRGRNPPHMFAHADFDAGRLGHVSGAVMPAFLNLHTMLLEGESVETYGRLISWDNDEDAMMKCVSGIAHQPGTGLMVLEIQEKNFQFLIECCRAILHDHDQDTLISKADIKPEPAPLSDSSEYPTLAMMAAEAPYRVPAQVNFLHLKALIAARRASAEDHIRALREDPGYFAETLADWSEHRQEKLLDTNGARHPVLDTPLFWQRVIGNVLMDAYGAREVWDMLHGHIDRLVSLLEKHSDNITPKETLPAEYIKALLTFRYDLGQASKGLISLLKTGFPASPPMRQSFVGEPHISGSTMIRVMSRGGSDQSTGRMLWLFNTLWTDSQLQLVGLPGLMDEIEYFVQSGPKEKAMLSPWTARELSDLGLVARALHELEIYQPWAAGFDHVWATEYGADIEADFPRRFSAFAETERNLKEASLVKALAQYGAPGDGRFFYPSDKRRTKQTTESMRQAESNLDLFWDTVDEHYLRKTGRTFDRNVGFRQLDRTPEWVESIKEQKSVPKQSSGDLHKPLSGLRLDSPDRPTKFVPPEQKTKPKTRGSTHDVLDNTPDITPQKIPDRQPTFTLKNRAYKVFKTLFFNPSQSDLPGEIPWADFLFAMASTGFAPEKLYGSVWQFTPTALDVERSIQFHEPHPVGKIPFRNARRIGRRLARAYGWHGRMFVLE
ncbi:hypothetical protein BDZ45DRAFT_674760 [Acephala macrosclerotiorum]|nr:hypothetical protein BDZ45DRAFT_674760 [Acephala macrosclerotiorum]